MIFNWPSNLLILVCIFNKICYLYWFLQYLLELCNRLLSHFSIFLLLWKNYLFLHNLREWRLKFTLFNYILLYLYCTVVWCFTCNWRIVSWFFLLLCFSNLLPFLFEFAFIANLINSDKEWVLLEHLSKIIIILLKIILIYRLFLHLLILLFIIRWF